ncbi:DUF2783 domain-containing protein [Burkholderiaceae bacterium FT117]|uniref:DUF2783 domain-containing protein n=1 Tax=Zeimonas sediminis TaxID=2944268 RepID=UPI00234303A5|nr:DUF2783 domain-containing protein [Zeimonas sediminis]MCM5571832.1 DUF2783 domain-containing protein [Zeimonas sediminis]
MPLIRTPNIPDPDGFYKELMDSQREMDEAQAAAMNARLVLLLANHVGDRAVLGEAIRIASAAAAASAT